MRELRGDIQGLRALAVLTVIAAHAGIGPLQGGFVGVDVFFVVSGFLISGLLYREIALSGRVSLAGFYARRARRILPAATVVLLATLTASMLFMSLVDSAEVVTDALWAALFSANVHVATEGADYFAQGLAPSPLQHYWSLAVEEQFYLLWPLALVGTLAWAAGREQAEEGLPRGLVLRVLLVLCGLSLAWSIWASAASPQTAYFSTFTRAWELGAGALTALLGPAAVRHATVRLRALLATAGLAAILGACVGYSPATSFPGTAALLPVLGTAAVLLAGVDPRPGQRVPAALRVLSVGPLRTIGDWSFSLYLWHWPILVVLEAHVGGPPSVMSTATALLLTFSLAALTYRWVEQPFRSGRRPAVPRGLVLYPVSLAVVATGAAGSYAWAQWGGPEDSPAVSLSRFGGERPQQASPGDRAAALVRASVSAAREGVAVPTDLSPDPLRLREDVASVGECDYARIAPGTLCTGGDPDAERTVVLLGDSHARAWIPAVDAAAREAGWRTHHLVRVQCTAADVTVPEPGTGEPWTECLDFNAWARAQVAELEPELVVVSATGPPTVLDEEGARAGGPEAYVAQMGAGFRRTLEELRGSAGRVVLLRDVPRAPVDPATCLTTRGHDLGDCLFEPVARADAVADASVAAAREAGVEVVDPTRWLCWGGSCALVVGDTITYRDAGHITATYAEQLSEALGEALGLAGEAAAGAGTRDPASP